MLLGLIGPPAALAGTPDTPADWHPVGPFVADVRVLAAVPGAPGRLLAGTAPEHPGSHGGSLDGSLYRSDDGGQHWRLHDQLNRSSVYDIEILPDGQTVWLSNTNTVWQSSDAGDTFSTVWTAGFRRVYDIAIDRLDDSVIWLAGASDAQGTELIVSDDGGLSFVDRSPPGDWPCLAAAVEGDDVAVACTEEAFTTTSRLWISSDRGQTWTDRTAGLPETGLLTVRRAAGRLYVAASPTTDGGLFVSDDDGATWIALHDETWPRRSATTVEVLASGSRLLVGTDGGGLFESTDGGATWSFAVGASDGWSVRAVTIDDVANDDEPQTLLGLRDLAFARRAGTDDFAVSHTGISDLLIHDVAVSRANPDVVAVATELTFGAGRGGIFTSTDGGAQWQLEAAPRGNYVAVDHGADGSLYALAKPPFTRSGVWRRGGDGWLFIGPDLSGAPVWRSLTVVEGADRILLIGGRARSPEGFRAAIYRTSDEGETWSRVLEGEPGSETVADVITLADGTLLAWVDDQSGTPVDSVLRSTDGGASWQAANSGLPPEVTIRGLCTTTNAPIEPFLLTRSEEHGVYQSGDRGASWWSAGQPVDFSALACDPETPRALYATRFNVEGRGVALSADGGATFSHLAEGAGLPQRAILDLAIRRDPDDDQEHELLMASRGVGLWALRLPRPVLFSDGFETGDTSRWSIPHP